MYLLDTNLLIALCDADHEHHALARGWFGQHSEEGWATCPLTENALLRIMGHPDYPGGPGSPAAVRPLLQQLRQHKSHTFLADSISLADETLLPELAGTGPRALTDLYLLALAVAHNCRFATLDGRIDPQLVSGGPGCFVHIR